MGPVVDTVYQLYKDHKARPIEEPLAGHPERLEPDERQVLAAVLERYGHMGDGALNPHT